MVRECLQVNQQVEGAQHVQSPRGESLGWSTRIREEIQMVGEEGRAGVLLSCGSRVFPSTQADRAQK